MVVAHAVAGEQGSRLAALLERRRELGGDAGPFSPIVAGVSGSPALIREAGEGLPAGAAHAEAVIARLRRAAVAIDWGEPIGVPRLAELLELCRRRGASSVELARADPSLVPHMQVGSWFRAGWQLRLARRATHRIAPSVLTVPGLLDLRALELALEAAFWTGVRSVATERELLRLTRSSYVALYYHRIAGEPGDERLDVPPRLFEAQLRLLRLLRFHPLSRHELLSFHTDPGALLPGRSYLLTADDGFLDAALALGQASGHAPQLFVATQLVGGRAPWAEGARLASWDDLEAAAAKGVAVGSHTRSHPVLPELAPEDLEDELAGSLADLRRHLPDVLPVLAYPHGRHDTATRHAAAAAGYRAGYTTAPGRNGAGSDPYRLSRIGIKAWDSRLAFLWRAATGEHLPRPWERWRLWLYRRGLTPGARRRQGGA